MPFIPANILRMDAGAFRPELQRVGREDDISISRFRNSGNASMHRSTNKWLKATIR